MSSLLDNAEEEGTSTPTPAESEGGGGEQEVARPDWLPEKFWNAEAKAPNVENLAKSYAELERMREVKADELKQQWEQERLAGRPEAPDKYELPEIEAFDAETFASSPIVALWRQAAHEAGLGQEQFAKVIEDYAKVESEKIEQAKAAEIAKLGENATARLSAVSNWLNASFKGEELDAIRRMATDAAGVQALERLMGMGNLPSDNGTEPVGTQPTETEADIRKLMNTPEYYDPHRRDPAIVRRVEQFFQRTYGKPA